MFEEKNKYLLNYNCYATNKYCSSLSEKKNGCCNNCLIKYNINKNDLNTEYLYTNYIVNKNEFIAIIQNLLNDVKNTINKEDKAIIVLKIFEHNLNNILYLISNFKYLLNVFNKIYDFIENEYSLFIKVIKENTEYIDIFEKIKYIYEFLKNNNKYMIIRLGININNEDLINSFIKDFINIINKIYNINIEDKEDKEEKEDKDKEEYKINNNINYSLVIINI